MSQGASFLLLFASPSKLGEHFLVPPCRCQMVAQERRPPLMSRCSYSAQMAISSDARNPSWSSILLRRRKCHLAEWDRVGIRKWWDGFPEVHTFFRPIFRPFFSLVVDCWLTKTSRGKTIRPWYSVGVSMISQWVVGSSKDDWDERQEVRCTVLARFTSSRVQWSPDGLR